MSDLTRSEIAASAFYVDPSNPRPRHRRPLTAEAFRDAGWIVTSLVRPGGAARAPTGTEIVEADATRSSGGRRSGARGPDYIARTQCVLHQVVRLQLSVLP